MRFRTISRGVVFALVLLALIAGSAVAKGGPPKSIGRGVVFFPNPVTYLKDQTLTDQDDADYAALQDAYVEVTLTHLDGSGYLRGDYAYIFKSVGPLAYSEDNTFIYDRHDDRFEQVMAYYWITEAQLYIQSLGFGTRFPEINNEPQDVRINQWGMDNSYSWDQFDILRFGKGGVDDAEDAEVILHEYAHSCMDSQSTPFGNWGESVESGAIGEGYADYVAVSITDVIAPNPIPELTPCVADWDSVSYTSDEPHCLRRIDMDWYYDTDLVGQVHHDGMIWSHALWDILLALGHEQADTIVLLSVFDYSPDSTMPEAAEVTVETSRELYGDEVASVVKAAFQARHILE